MAGKQNWIYNNQLDKQILELTHWWYRYVGLDHHKDRDCHWYITEDWAYGMTPMWTIEHNGYVFDGKDDRVFNTREGAKLGLIALIEEAITSEKEWAKLVLNNPKEWDEYQIKKAKMADECLLVQKNI